MITALSLVTVLVQVVAKHVFKYQDKVFKVRGTDASANGKEVEVWNGHGYMAVETPTEAAAGTGYGAETRDGALDDRGEVSPPGSTGEAFPEGWEGFVLEWQHDNVIK
jgi:O-antigen ligase